MEDRAARQRGEGTEWLGRGERGWHGSAGVRRDRVARQGEEGQSVSAGGRGDSGGIGSPRFARICWDLKLRE